jgi:histidine ammonia-lyase
VEAVAWGGERLALAPAALERVAAGQAELLGRAVGGPPWLPAGEARALLVARLGNLLSGHAGVGPDLAAVIVALEQDELPLP